MAMKKVVKITGTAKSTSGSSASKNIKIKGLGSSSDKAQLKKAAAKKANPMKESAKSHQKDLAKMSGETAAMKKFKADKKAGIRSAENKPSRAYTAGKKAEKRTLKSFK
jgi:phosphoribosylcarboxyaminoimidazole (NCAIR) mutase